MDFILAYKAPAKVAAYAAEHMRSFSEHRNLSVADIIRLASEHQVKALVITGKQRFDAATIAALAARVKHLATATAGVDHIDLDAAAGRGLIVTNTPDVLTDCTADFALLLLLAACRRAREYLAIMTAGWGQAYGQSDLMGVSLAGKRLGIIGMGRIGRAVAKRARAFGMEIHYNSRHRLPPSLEGDAVYHAELDDLLRHSQMLTLHAPATAATRHIINKTSLAVLPRGAVLVNTARGALVDEEALIAALQSGHLAAAGLDVFANEPQLNPVLREMPQVFMTPHMGSATVETRTAMGMQALRNVEAVLGGYPPLNAVY